MFRIYYYYDDNDNNNNHDDVYDDSDHVMIIHITHYNVHMFAFVCI